MCKVGFSSALETESPAGEDGHRRDRKRPGGGPLPSVFPAACLRSRIDAIAADGRHRQCIAVLPRPGPSNVTVTHYGPRRAGHRGHRSGSGTAGGRAARRGDRGRQDDGGAMNVRARRRHGRRDAHRGMRRRIRMTLPSRHVRRRGSGADSQWCRQQFPIDDDAGCPTVAGRNRPGRIAPPPIFPAPDRPTAPWRGGPVLPGRQDRQPGAREFSRPAPAGGAWRRLAAKLRGVFRRLKIAPIPNPPSSLRCPHMRPGSTRGRP